MGFSVSHTTITFNKCRIIAFILVFLLSAAKVMAVDGVIKDGGFENGPGDESAWKQGHSLEDQESHIEALIEPEMIPEWGIQAYQCNYAFWGGGSIEVEEDKTAPFSNYIEQADIHITADTLGLGFATCFYRTDDDDILPDDYFYINIAREDEVGDEIIEEIFNTSIEKENNTYPDWKYHIIDIDDDDGNGVLDGYANEVITLCIGVESGINTQLTGNVLVDDVKLFKGKQQPCATDKIYEYDSQAYLDDGMEGMDIFLADDFSFFNDGDVNNFPLSGDTDNQKIEICGIKIEGTFENAANISESDDVQLHFEIYNDSFGNGPDGNPTDPDNKPLWALSLPANDPQIDISTVSIDINPDPILVEVIEVDVISIYPTTPITLASGIYWLVFYPEMSETDFGQFKWHVSNTTNGHEAMVINPGGKNTQNVPDQWTYISDINWGGEGDIQHDLAFTIYYQVAGDPAIGVSTDSLKVELSEDSSATTGFTITNSGDGLLEIESIGTAAEWVGIYPEKGTVQNSCGEMDVVVNFNTAGMDISLHSDIIQIDSNDPDDGIIYIPVEMTVIAATNDDDSDDDEFDGDDPDDDKSDDDAKKEKLKPNYDFDVNTSDCFINTLF